jgi:aspartate kinase
MIVMKFGGSSLADADCLRQVGSLVRERLAQAPLVVLSAMGRTTDHLFTMARAAERGDLASALEGLDALGAAHRQAAEDLFDGRVPEAVSRALFDQVEELGLRLRGVSLLGELSPRSLDAITAFGEQLSTLLFAAWFQAPCVDARRVLITDASFGEAQPQPEQLRARAADGIRPLLGPGRAVVTQGYVGGTTDGLTTTLGRGGSDYSAALLGAALGAEELQIWTDVEGVLTCDPRVVPEAQPIAELSFAEAAELAAFGAKILHPATIQPAVEADIPVTVRHTRRPEGAFTTITGQVATGRPVTALASRDGLTVLTVSSTRMLQQAGFLARLFEVFARHRVSVDLVATAEVSVSLTVDADVILEPLLDELRAFATVCVVRDRALVAVVGERLKVTPGLAGRIFTALGDLNVEMISMGANEINLSMVLAAADAPQALLQLHQALMVPLPGEGRRP